MPWSRRRASCWSAYTARRHQLVISRSLVEAIASTALKGIGNNLSGYMIGVSSTSQCDTPGVRTHTVTDYCWRTRNRWDAARGKYTDAPYRKSIMAWHRTTSTGFVRESVGTSRSCMRLTEPQAQRRLAPKGAPDPKTTHYPTRATVLPDRQQQPVCSRVCWGGGACPQASARFGGG